MEIIKKWKERRAQRKKIKELSSFASGLSTLDKLNAAGLLDFNPKSRQLLIEQSVALLMMRDADSWTNFINNVFLWQYSKECGKAWENYFQQEELKAVRDISDKLPKGKSLSRQDVQRIREARRQEIAASEIEPPKVEGFEFFIVAPPDLNSSIPNTDGPVGKLISVGHYDPITGETEMELWSNISHLISQNNE